MEGFGLNPLRIRFDMVGPVSDRVVQEYIDAALGAGIPLVEPRQMALRKLAVVGGGPSVWEYLPQIASSGGDIWGINQSAPFLQDHGIDCTLLAVDSGEDVAGWAAQMDRALLASNCHPEVFRALAGKDVRMFHIAPFRDGPGLSIKGGPSASTRAPQLAIALGYSEVTFYGCEGSFDGSTHAYRHEPERLKQLIVRAGGKLYRTAPDLMLMSEYLANDIRAFQGIFRERSGGLLRAMVEHFDTWEVAAFSEALKAELDPNAPPFELA